ncbi:DUF6552 family protein [Leucothrix pacifica]|uniref:Ubiquinone biosynthesis methyltransferase UbiE n=1 Tax=Leucothrix pacifica TaxID=1247513 RepID=A0A317C0J1_9GAMM|nr:DUF6552 family protein [Leucothrix pacifica]PWQ92165.1 ubiquinone biosynthesis methyltransferase UbiE [Leucothrix pacifica]
MQAVIHQFELQKDSITFYFKWVASIIQILGYAATAFELTPWNTYLFLAGISGWLVVGLLWNDKAIILIHVIALAVMLAGTLS